MYPTLLNIYLILTQLLWGKNFKFGKNGYLPIYIQEYKPAITL